MRVQKQHDFSWKRETLLSTEYCFAPAMDNFILELTKVLLYDLGQSQMKVKHCQQTKTNVKL